MDLSSHSRSTENTTGGSPLTSQSAITCCGDWAVCSGASAMPSIDRTSRLRASSAALALPASTQSRRCSRSSQSCSALVLVKAIGSSSWVAWSFSSPRSFLPGLRPAVCSICAAISSTRCLTTEAGSSLRSTFSRSSQCRPPPTLSTSGACGWPRGGTQPSDIGWLAPQGTKADDASSASSAVSSGGCQSVAMR